MDHQKLQNRVHFKIGEIEFEAEGSAEIVERERSVFLNALLPAAVDAIVRTRGVERATQYIEAVEKPVMLVAVDDANGQENITQVVSPSHVDLSRTSLASFITSYGKLSDQDFTMIAAYYDEKKNGVKSFTSESVKQYYADTRKQKYSNNSALLRQLVQKGFIMDDPNAERQTPKSYILTNDGLNYVETYQPKQNGDEKTNYIIDRKSLVAKHPLYMYRYAQMT